jgi:hypothetical protein
MMQHRLTCLAFSILLLGILGMAVAAQPPKDLHLVGDHWTAWDPPATYPEGSEIYVIEKGDTLWDLSNRFYGDPYLWPQLWERNQYVLDAHWIYPGDTLVVGLEITPVEELTMDVGEGVGEGVPEGDQLFDRAPGAPVALGSEDDIYCTGYIDEPNEVFPFHVVGAEYESLTPTMRDFSARRSSAYRLSSTSKLGLLMTDIVYLDGGRQAGMMAGDVYSAVRPERLVKHPETNKTLGRFYRYLGRVRVLTVQEETAIAEIVHSCLGIGLDDGLKPFVPEPVPLSRQSGLIGINNPAEREELRGAPMIVSSNYDQISLGQGHMVFIDRGSLNDVTPGDLFTIYRKTPAGQPPLIVGELGILSVREEASLAKILKSRYAIHIGDRLDPKFE